MLDACQNASSFLRMTVMPSTEAPEMSGAARVPATPNMALSPQVFIDNVRRNFTDRLRNQSAQMLVLLQLMGVDTEGVTPETHLAFLKLQDAFAKEKTLSFATPEECDSYIDMLHTPMMREFLENNPNSLMWN